MCQRHQVQVTTLTPVVSSTCCRCLPSFDHTDYSFTLPSLAILFFVQHDLHATPIFARGLFSRGTAEVGRDGGLYFEFVPRECMIRFTVVPRVCHDVADSYLPRCAFQRRFEISKKEVKGQAYYDLQVRMNMLGCENARAFVGISCECRVFARVI